MRLAAKLIVTMMLGVLLLLTADAVVTVRRAVEMYEQDMQRDAATAGHLLRPVVEDEWQRGGRARAAAVIEETSREEHLLRFRLVLFRRPAEASFRPRVAGATLGAVGAERPVSLEGPWDDGGRGVYTYLPLRAGTEMGAALEISESTRPLEAYAKRARNKAVVVLALATALSGVVVVVLGLALVGRPLRRVGAKVRRIAAGDLSGPLALPGHDEISELARGIDSMCRDVARARRHADEETAARIQALEQLRHAERLTTVGTLAAGVAHELGTPLNVVAGRAALIMQGDLPPAEVAGNARIIKAQADRMTAIIRQLLDFARRPAPERTDLAMPELVEDTMALLSTHARKRGVRLTMTAEEPLPVVRADRGQLQQVLTNLMLNGIQAMPDGGEVEIALAPARATPPADHGAEADAGAYLHIAVRDRGPGIPEAMIQQVFDPFFTTKDVGEGTGLGLSIAHGIVREHGGWIDLTSTVGAGSCFAVFLPAERMECPVGS